MGGMSRPAARGGTGRAGMSRVAEEGFLDDATLLLLPGLLCDAALWRHQAASLGGARRVLVADLTRDDTVDAMARRALALASGPLAVCGLSMGGYVAQAMLRLAPERVRRVLLMSTGARPDTPEAARRRRAQLALASRPGTRFLGVSPRMLPDLLHPDRLADPSLGEAVLAMAARVGREGFRRQLTAVLRRPDERPFLRALTLPATVMVGEGDRVTPPALAMELAALLPAARLVVLGRCGHLPPLEDPEAVTSAMRRWLEDDHAHA